MTARRDPPKTRQEHAGAIRAILSVYEDLLHRTYYEHRSRVSVRGNGRAWAAMAHVNTLCRQQGWDPERYLQALFEKYPRLSRFGGVIKPFHTRPFPVQMAPNKFSQQLYREWEAVQEGQAPDEPIRRRLARQRAPVRGGDRALRELAVGLDQLWQHYVAYRHLWPGQSLPQVLPMIRNFVELPPGCVAVVGGESSGAVEFRVRELEQNGGWERASRLLQAWGKRYGIPVEEFQLREEVRG